MKIKKKLKVFFNKSCKLLISCKKDKRVEKIGYGETERKF